MYPIRAVQVAASVRVDPWLRRCRRFLRRCRKARCTPRREGVTKPCSFVNYTGLQVHRDSHRENDSPRRARRRKQRRLCRGPPAYFFHFSSAFVEEFLQYSQAPNFLEEATCRAASSWRSGKVFCFLKKLSEVRMLTTLYLAKNDHQWGIFISLKMIKPAELVARKQARHG